MTVSELFALLLKDTLIRLGANLGLPTAGVRADLVDTIGAALAAKTPGEDSGGPRQLRWIVSQLQGDELERVFEARRRGLLDLAAQLIVGEDDPKRSTLTSIVDLTARCRRDPLEAALSSLRKECLQGIAACLEVSSEGFKSDLAARIVGAVLPRARAGGAPRDCWAPVLTPLDTESLAAMVRASGDWLGSGGAYCTSSDFSGLPLAGQAALVERLVLFQGEDPRALVDDLLASGDWRDWFSSSVRWSNSHRLERSVAATPRSSGADGQDEREQCDVGSPDSEADDDYAYEPHVKLSSGVLDDRPYQTEAHDALTGAFEDFTRVLLVLPTGSGKTLIAARWLASAVLARGRRVLWLSHREELLRQAEDAFRRVLYGAGTAPNGRVTFWMAGREDEGGDVVLAMVSKHGMPDGRFDFVVIDEAHHAAAPSYRRWRERFRSANQLGLTATPERLDKRELGFDDIAYQRSFWDLVQDGYLSRPDVVEIQTRTHCELRYDKRKRDFEERSLATLNTEPRNRCIVESYLSERRRYGRTLVFAVDIAHCEALVETFRRLAPQVRVDVITTRTGADRSRIVEDFKSGRLDVLVNCRVFVEGFDDPGVQTVFLTRPTTSPVLFCQMIGRGARRTTHKSSYWVVDFQDQNQLAQFAPKLAGMWVLGTRPADARLKHLPLAANPQARLDDLPLANSERLYARSHHEELAGVVTFTHGDGGVAGAALVWRTEIDGVRDAFRLLAPQGSGVPEALSNCQVLTCLASLHWPQHVRATFESAVGSRWRVRLFDFAAAPAVVPGAESMVGPERAAAELAATVGPLRRIQAFLGDPAQVASPAPLGEWLNEVAAAGDAVAGVVRFRDHWGGSGKWLPVRLTREDNAALTRALEEVRAIPLQAAGEVVVPRRIEQIYEGFLAGRTRISKYEWHEIARSAYAGDQVHLSLL
ncbi:MAG TPA: DEAD/DEAH box helicase [Polyangia bacterium]|jgi:superfamily II DNA or RNA helicase